MSLLISVLITFVVIILVLYLVNMLPIDGRAQRSVPYNVAESGMTLHADPAVICAIVTTAHGRARHAGDPARSRRAQKVVANPPVATWRAEQAGYPGSWCRAFVFASWHDRLGGRHKLRSIQTFYRSHRSPAR